MPFSINYILYRKSSKMASSCKKRDFTHFFAKNKRQDAPGLANRSYRVSLYPRFFWFTCDTPLIVSFICHLFYVFLTITTKVSVFLRLCLSPLLKLINFFLFKAYKLINFIYDKIPRFLVFN